jgi:ornithine--oxo-acid transaminase
MTRPIVGLLILSGSGCWGSFAQVLVMRLFQHHNILSQIWGNNFMVLKAAPPLVVTEGQLEQYVNAVEATMETVHSSSNFWSDALNLARPAVRV